MMRLLFADDEPLVLIGLQHMLRWEDYDIHICGTAHNGQQALQLIEAEKPDIVITDIKMPLKSGLEVAQICQKKYGKLPVFIMLTSYEEFDYVKTALHVGSVDYLLKLELTSEQLGKSILRATKRVQEISNKKSPDPTTPSTLQMFEEKFFARLYNNLFETRSQFEYQRNDLKLEFSAPFYVVVACEIIEWDQEMPLDKLVTLYLSTLTMVSDTVKRSSPCHITSLDMKHFNLLFPLSEAPIYQLLFKDVLENVIEIVHNYFNVSLLCAVSRPVKDIFSIAQAYHDARELLIQASPNQSIVFTPANSSTSTTSFYISQYKIGLSQAFEEFNTTALYDLITEITDYFSQHPDQNIVAMDAASTLLYIALTLLPDGENTMNFIFSHTPHGYRSLYQNSSALACCQWMLTLRNGLCNVLHSHKQNYKERVVTCVQEYIKNNLNKKLTLHEVAASFNFSPAYLSRLFGKSSTMGFVDYITECKMNAAKEMLSAGDKKIYEISEALGYESAFYFSKVFKKTVGLSPREYMQNRYLKREQE